jgi:hypothetical protein
MKINFEQTLKSIDQATDLKDENNQPVTLATICINALMQPCKEKGEEKLKRLDLAFVIYSAKEPVDLKPEQIVMLNKLIDEMYESPLIAAQALRMLEG